MCYRDYGNPTLPASLTCTLLASTSAADASEGASVVVSSLDSPSVSFAELDSTAGVVCYAAFGRNEGKPTCNVISLEESDIQAGPDVVVDEGLIPVEQSTYVELTTVAGLSSTAAVMCYRTSDQTAQIGVLRCAALTRTGNELEVSSTTTINTAFSKDVSVVGFSESMAMACYSDNYYDTTAPFEDYRGFCRMLNISGEEITIANGDEWPIQLWVPVDTTFTRTLVAQSLSADTALVCISVGRGSSEGGYCVYVEVTASTVTNLAELPITADAMSHMALKRFSDETAVLCYLTDEECDDEDTQVTCVEMYASGRAGEANLTKGNPLMLDGAETCKIPAISSVSEEDGVVCYTETGSGNDQQWARCVPVEVTPTSTSTGTDTSTTPHTTTETITTSTGSSTATSITGTSSTTPHTTTGTSSATETVTATTETTATVTAAATTQTAEEQVPDSGAIRFAGTCAPVAAFLVAQLLN
jgi:hypothetical protein